MLLLLTPLIDAIIKRSFPVYIHKFNFQGFDKNEHKNTLYFFIVL